MGNSKTAVDAELFDTLEEAIKFVAEAGGGTVYTQHWNTMLGKSLIADYKGRGVELKRWRPPATEEMIKHG